MNKFNSLLLANLLVVLIFIFSSSLDKHSSFLGEVLIFLWGGAVFVLLIILIILMIIDNILLKSKKWKFFIVIETAILASLFLFSQYVIYLIFILGIIQYIKYIIYSYFIVDYKEKNNE